MLLRFFDPLNKLLPNFSIESGRETFSYGHSEKTSSSIKWAPNGTRPLKVPDSTSTPITVLKSGV